MKVREKTTFSRVKSELALCLGGVTLVFIVYALISDIPYFTDPLAHHLINKATWKHPYLFLHTWNRPLYGLFFSPFAQLGYYAERLAHVAISVVVCYLTYLIAIQLKIKRSYLSVLTLAFQTAFFATAWTNETEAFSLVFILLAIICYMRQQWLVSSLLISTSSLVRPEGAILILIWVVLLLLKKQFIPAILSFTGPFLWNFAGFIANGDPIWLLHSSPYNTALGLRIIQFDYIIKFFDDLSGPAIFVLFQIGALVTFLGHNREFKRKLYILNITSLAIFVFIVAIRENILVMPSDDIIGWRHILFVSPAVAIYANMGFNYILDDEGDNGFLKK